MGVYVLVCMGIHVVSCVCVCLCVRACARACACAYVCVLMENDFEWHIKEHCPLLLIGSLIDLDLLAMWPASTRGLPVPSS